MPPRNETLPFELGKRTHATPGADGNATSPGALRSDTGAPALPVTRSMGTRVCASALTTHAVVPVVSMSRSVGVAPTGTVATTARVTRLTIETVWSFRFANAAV